MKKIKSVYVFCVFLLICVAAGFVYRDRLKYWAIYGTGWYLFDVDYYVKKYPEVRGEGDPFDHFMRVGINEGKNPNINFNTFFYINYTMTFNNVAQEHIFWHYLKAKLSFKNPITKKSQIRKVDRLLDNPKYHIALVAIFRNEARFLKEWIEFYRLMGVEHFYLYNHLSNDNFQEVLDPYIKEGIVELKHVHQDPKTVAEWYAIQNKAYTETVKNVADSVEWLVVVDTDEFLFPTKDASLKALLKKYDQYAGLAVCWKIFGTAGVFRVPDNKLLIETLKSSGDGRGEKAYVKTIVKPRHVESFTNPHYPSFKNGHYLVTEDHEFIADMWARRDFSDIARINHYWARDHEFFKFNKIARIHLIGDKKDRPTVDDTIEYNRKFSSIYDDSIARFVLPLRAKVFKDLTN